MIFIILLIIITNGHIYTFIDKKTWFQVELTKGYAIVHGFRLKRINFGKTRSFQIIGTDVYKSNYSEWIKLAEIIEEDENEHEIFYTYEFKNPSPPIRFIRLKQIGPTWDNLTILTFMHFDFFGYYF